MGSLIHLLAQSHLSIRPMKAILVLQHDTTPSLCTLPHIALGRAFPHIALGRAFPLASL